VCGLLAQSSSVGMHAFLIVFGGSNKRILIVGARVSLRLLEYISMTFCTFNRQDTSWALWLVPGSMMTLRTTSAACRQAQPLADTTTTRTPQGTAMALADAAQAASCPFSCTCPASRASACSCTCTASLRNTVHQCRSCEPSLHLRKWRIAWRRRICRNKRHGERERTGCRRCRELRARLASALHAQDAIALGASR